jgi:hypothetical protein
MLLYVLFIASLLSLSIMIGLRIRQLRLGVQFEHRIENRHLPEINLSATKNTLTFYTKRFGHMFVLEALRIWIKIKYFIKRKTKELEPKIVKLLTPKKRRHLPASENPVSHFLKSISDYKQKIKHAHEHMSREEEAKDEDTGTL